MDEILGTSRWSELYLILERLSTNLRQIPTHIDDFCRAICDYPDEALREELTTMVREARLRESVRLENDLVNITPNNYFEMIDYWLGDIDEEAIHNCAIRWANVATELGGACQIASRAAERSSSEWALTERWVQDIGTRQKLLEETLQSIVGRSGGPTHEGVSHTQQWRSADTWSLSYAAPKISVRPLNNWEDFGSSSAQIYELSLQTECQIIVQ
ncbi:hypothetical protein FRC00_003423 [Tulasnella sp. 408]|nr:hypothetical protein FRC00_003423 [Tulasnella sp. 408]